MQTIFILLSFLFYAAGVAYTLASILGTDHSPWWYLPVFVGLGWAFRKASEATTPKPENESKPQLKIPAVALCFLWIMTNVLSIASWDFSFGIFSSDWFAENIFSGMIAGIFQWLLLIFIIPKANRWLLALWIPSSMLSSAIENIILMYIPYGSNVFTAAVNGVVIGVLQWLILQKYSKVAALWIPASIIDFVVSSLLVSSIWENFHDTIVINFLFGVVGSFVSSIVMVFILKKSPYLGSNYKNKPGENTTRVILENPQPSLNNVMLSKIAASSQSPLNSQNLAQTTDGINLRNDLLEAELAIANNDKKSAALLIDKVLKQDYVNPVAWQLLYQLLGNGKEFSTFQKDFTERYYPDKARYLSNNSPNQQNRA